MLCIPKFMTFNSKTTRHDVVESLKLKHKHKKCKIVHVGVPELMIVNTQWACITDISLNYYNFVHRCGKSFCGEVVWIHLCAYGNKRSQFVYGLSSSVSSTYDLFSKTYPEDFHISAVKWIVQELIDGVYDLTPETESDGM